MSGYFMCIPTYNGESKNFGPLLSSAKSFVRDGIFEEVVVVNDGSTDKTPQIASEFDVTVLNHNRNRGKAAAFLTGILYGGFKYDGVLICDDDMIDLTAEQVKQSMMPVQDSSVLMTRSPYSQERQVCPPHLSGFRTIKMRLLQELYDQTCPKHDSWNKLFAEAGWGLETILEKKCSSEEKAVVKIPGLKSMRRGSRANVTFEKNGRKIIIPNMHNQMCLAYSRMEHLGLSQE